VPRIQLPAALLFCAVGLVAAWAAGVDLVHLDHLSAAAAIAAGVVAVGGAVAVAAGGRPGRRARLAAISVSAIWAVGFLGVGLAAFDNRAAAALVELPATLEPRLTAYCPPPGEREPPPPPPPKKVAQAQGCALIIRAYELGYAKSLGSCAPQAAEPEVAPDEAPAAEPCRDRRRGEPLFHYSWRVLERSLSGAAELAGSGAAGEVIDETRARLDYVEPLAGRQWHAIASSPHSTHHLFTNLPAPRQPGLLERALGESPCSEQVSELEARLDFDSPSALVEHAHAMMLFDPRFGEPVGSCREHTIHWGQAPAICERLRESPAAALDDAGILDDVEATLSRLRHAIELAELDARLGRRSGVRLPRPAEIASFHCLVVTGPPEGGREPRRAKTMISPSSFSRAEVEVAGASIEILELRVGALAATGPAQLEVYQALSQVLGGERYAGPLESEPADRLEPADYLDGEGFALARLDALREVDPFVAGAGPLERAELRSIYPLAIHLAQLIEVFRRTYRKQRRRL
jgi:hypothetical protein